MISFDSVFRRWPIETDSPSRPKSPRNPRNTVVLAIMLVVCSSARAQESDKRCVIEHPHLEQSETIVSTMSVINDGEPCTMNIQLGGQPATSTIIKARPVNGVLSRTKQTVSYTPNPGFAGKDAFDVQWFGLGFGPNSPSKNVRTRVDVTVRAKSDQADAKSDAPAK